MCLAREERRLPRQILPDEQRRGQKIVERLDAVEGDGHLGVDDRIDDQPIAPSGGLQRVARPPGPPRIIRRDVHQHVGVHQDAGAHPRVSAMISSVLIVVSALPRNRSIALCSGTSGG